MNLFCGLSCNKPQRLSQNVLAAPGKHLTDRHLIAVQCTATPATLCPDLPHVRCSSQTGNTSQIANVDAPLMHFVRKFPRGQGQHLQLVQLLHERRNCHLSAVRTAKTVMVVVCAPAAAVDWLLPQPLQPLRCPRTPACTHQNTKAPSTPSRTPVEDAATKSKQQSKNKGVNNTNTHSYTSRAIDTATLDVPLRSMLDR